MRATISILGMYEYDQTIFDNMVLPGGIDKENVVQNICLELAELEVLYSNPVTMKLAIGMWSKKQLPVWQKLYDTTTIKYDPISNYDRTEEWTENTTANKTNSRNENRNSEANGTGKVDTNGETTNSGSDTVNSEVSAFNEVTCSPKEKQTTTLGTKNTTNGATNSENTANQHENVDSKFSENENNTNIRTGRAYGNIGVTTTQQMLEQERNTAKFNITDYIIDEFKQRFCLLVY